MLDFDVRVPTEMGGPGGATNPEQLFAAGYAACFHSHWSIHDALSLFHQPPRLSPTRRDTVDAGRDRHRPPSKRRVQEPAVDAEKVVNQFIEAIAAGWSLRPMA